MPGSTPPTSQLDWLSSTTAMIVLFWSRATRDLLKSFGWGIATLHRLHAATKLPPPRRPPHRIFKFRARRAAVLTGLYRRRPSKVFAFPPKRPVSWTRDRWFESVSLQRRVRCEPVSRGNSPSYVEKPRFHRGDRRFESAFLQRRVRLSWRRGLNL